MTTKIKNNRIFFNEEDKAYANLTLIGDKDLAHLELIKVEPKYRRMHLATHMMEKLLSYIDKRGYTNIELNPLPLDLTGMNLNQLIGFYKKFGFKLSNSKSRSTPYLMKRVYCCL